MHFGKEKMSIIAFFVFAGLSLLGSQPAIASYQKQDCGLFEFNCDEYMQLQYFSRIYVMPTGGKDEEIVYMWYEPETHTNWDIGHIYTLFASRGRDGKYALRKPIRMDIENVKSYKNGSVVKYIKPTLAGRISIEFQTIDDNGHYARFEPHHDRMRFVADPQDRDAIKLHVRWAERSGTIIDFPQ